MVVVGGVVYPGLISKGGSKGPCLGEIPLHKNKNVEKKSYYHVHIVFIYPLDMFSLARCHFWLFKLYIPASDGLSHCIGRVLDPSLRKGRGSRGKFKGAALPLPVAFMGT